MKLLFKGLLLITIFIATSILCFSQTGVYKTFEDYQNGKLEEIIDVKKAYRDADSFGNAMVFKTGDGKKRYKTKSFWGFVYKGVLFRSNCNGYGRDNVICVKDSGKVIYYLNGQARLDQINGGFGSFSGNNAGFEDGVENYISLDLNSQIYPTPWNSYGKNIFRNQNKSFTKFQEDNPQFQVLYDCIGDTYSSSKARNCIQNFNSTK